MTLDKIFDNFTSKMLEIELFKRVVEDSSNKELSELIKNSKEIKKLSKEEQDEFYEGHNFIFYSALDGKVKFYGNKNLTIKEMQKLTVNRKNKQYQWLLVDAYEAFEDFIEDIFAYLGYKDKNLWMMSDYGNIYPSEIDNKDYTWFLEQSRKKKDRPKSILNHLRKKFPKIEQLESNNKLNVNLKLSLIICENFRHIIVHENGIIKNDVKFTQKLLEKAGLYNNGNPNNSYKDFIKQFFGINEYANHIMLLDRSINHKSNVFNMKIDVLSMFIRYLIAYAEVIKSEVQKIENI